MPPNDAEMAAHQGLSDDMDQIAGAMRKIQAHAGALVKV